MLLLLYTPWILNDVFRSISPLQFPPILHFLLDFNHSFRKLLEFSQPNGCLIRLLPSFGVCPGNLDQLSQILSMLEHDVFHLTLEKAHGLNSPFATLDFFDIVDEIPFDELLDCLRCFFLEIEYILKIRSSYSLHLIKSLQPQNIWHHIVPHLQVLYPRKQPSIQQCLNSKRSLVVFHFNMLLFYLQYKIDLFAKRVSNQHPLRMVVLHQTDSVVVPSPPQHFFNSIFVPHLVIYSTHGGLNDLKWILLDRGQHNGLDRSIFFEGPVWNVPVHEAQLIHGVIGCVLIVDVDINNWGVLNWVSVKVYSFVFDAGNWHVATRINAWDASEVFSHLFYFFYVITHSLEGVLLFRFQRSNWWFFVQRFALSGGWSLLLEHFPLWVYSGFKSIVLDVQLLVRSSNRVRLLLFQLYFW